MSEESHPFQINMEGVLELLGEHIYSNRDVFLRELLQNGHDAIVQGQAARGAGHRPEIRFEVREPDKAGERPVLSVRDNGVGMTEEDTHQFLATIANSGKRALVDGEHDLIGRFGIGLLSAFMISDAIEVQTISVRPGSPLVIWEGRSTGRYTVRVEPAGEREPGTVVTIRAKPGSEQYFGVERVRGNLLKFGRLLPVPVCLMSRQGEDRINAVRAPWQRRFASAEAEERAYETLAAEVFGSGESYLAHVPLRSEAGGVKGVAYIPVGAVKTIGVEHQHRVFLRGMYLGSRGEQMLPRWAVFARCVFDARKLKPTASREAVYEDEVLEQTRREIGESLMEGLRGLAEREPEKLDRVCRIHELSIKELALQSDDAFRCFVPCLPFITENGPMPFREIQKSWGRIFHARTVDEYRQILALARHRPGGMTGGILVNGGFNRDRDLLDRVSGFFEGVEVVSVSPQELFGEFLGAPAQRDAASRRLSEKAGEILREFGCGVQVRSFDPADLAALFVAGESGTLRKLMIDQGGMEADALSLLQISAEAILGGSKAAENVLCLNARNPIVQRLRVDPEAEKFPGLVRMLYVLALLQGHHPLGKRERDILNDEMMGYLFAQVQMPEI